MADATTDPLNDANNAPRFTVRGQYIKDLSFENPAAPSSLIPKKEQPKIDINVDLAAQQVGEAMFESNIKIRVSATVEGKPLFLVELTYGGLFEISGLSKERIEPMLFIDCPFILFPFARRVIADVSRDGGFPPLMLEPIDFHQLYARRKQEQMAE